MRPMASTWVASMQNIAAPDSASELMWVKCQSVAEPSSAEYWHIGETMMRLARFRPRNWIGANRALMRECSGGWGWKEDGGRLITAARLTNRHAAYIAMRLWRGLCARSTAGHAHWSSKTSNLPVLRSMTL